MENYIEQLLCVEVCEKIGRFKRYLKSQYSSSKTEGKEVVSLFMKAIKNIEECIGNVVGFLSQQPELSNPEKAAVLRQISTSFIAITKLHTKLELVYGSWVRPETYTFIEEVLAFIPKDRRPEKVNVVLTNEYSFLENNLANEFSEILAECHINVELDEPIPTVFLPKIDLENPLNWSILVHECGHVDWEGLRELLSNPEIINPDLDSNDQEILRNWAAEIYCDLFATLILGPAYLVSFSTYALLLSGIEGNEIAQHSHPANIVRIAVIYEVLDKLDLKIPLSNEILGCNDLGTFCFTVLEQYNELSRKFLNTYSPLSSEAGQLPFDISHFVDVISEKVQSLVKVDLSLSLEDFDRIRHLKHNLSRGITIASYQELSKLEALRSSFPIEGVDKAMLDLGKSALQETRTKLFEIINAGWLNKIENIYPLSFELFFDNQSELSIHQKIDQYDDMLLGMDRVLLKSIESSHIFKIMEDK